MLTAAQKQKRKKILSIIEDSDTVDFMTLLKQQSTKPHQISPLNIYPNHSTTKQNLD